MRLAPAERPIITLRRVRRNGRQGFLYPVTGSQTCPDIRAGFQAYRSERRYTILRRMEENDLELGDAFIAPLEFVKACPACEHTDPELERELQAFAQLLFDIYLESYELKGSESDRAFDKIR